MNSLNDDYFELVQNTFWGFVGFELIELKQQYAKVVLHIQPHHLNMAGIVNGGVLTTMLDNTMGLVVMFEQGLNVVTASMNTHFLANTKNNKIYCSAELLHRTKRTITMKASIEDEEGELLAFASGSFRVLK